MNLNNELASNDMKRILFAAAIACMALFTSCEKQGVDNTGDTTGNLYGVWTLDSVTEASSSSDKGTVTDYSGVHFYLSIGEFPFPHAIAKKGSFTDFDLDDVDVDAVSISYNADQKKISFKKMIWLSEGIKYNMILNGTFDVLELTDKKFVIRQSAILSETTTTYSYSKYK